MWRKGFGKILTKTVSLVLAASFCFNTTGANELWAKELPAEEDAASSAYSYDADYVGGRTASNYTKVSGEYTLPEYEGEEIVYNSSEILSDTEEVTFTTDTYDYEGSDKVADINRGDTVTMTVDVPESAQYYIMFEYLSYDESILPIEFSMTVDGEYPFYECRNLELETTWRPDGEKSYDRYDNEVVTVPDKVIQWETKYLMDSSYRNSMPLAVELDSGTHEITIAVNEGKFLFGNITLSAPYKIAGYEGGEDAAGDAFIEIQGEDYTTTNDSSIHGVAEYDTGVEPYATGDTVLNTLDSDSFDTAGQEVSYEFYVESEGSYFIAANYRQSDKTDFPVFVDVKIDGQIPNTAFASYPMAYTSKYKTSTLTDEDGNYLSVYLEEGIHTISYTISMDIVKSILEELDEIMSKVNDLELEVTKVAGTNSDKYRDLKITRYIPDLEEKLRGYADRLYTMEKSMLPYSDSDKSVAVMSSMIIAAEQLISLADNTDEIAYRIGELSSSMNSVNHHLAATIDNLIANNLAIDRIYIYQKDADLPRNPGFFQALVMNLQRFAASFTKQAYSTSNTDPEHLQVWVNRSSQYVQVMQKMIDEYFTPETGIEVDISIMPDQYKLVLANSSGDAPDVATGINYTIPYELAIRGALEDLTQFEDFRKTAEPYEEGFFMTSTINDSIYALPETMNFWVQFYREDTLQKLGLEVPETMDEVIAMLPELQMRGLNYYYPTAGMLTLRNFHGTTPLITQYGGSLYSRYASDGTALGSEASVDGFTALTDLFTIYGLPINIDNFYQHFRNGDLPIGIADYTTYNLLTNAAPELTNSWDISAVPGIIGEDGRVNRSTCGCAESTVMFKSENAERRAQSWQFMKWWASTETQAEFGQIMQITYGDEYMWATANIDAFMRLPWDTGAKEVIAGAAGNVVDVARIPGTYLIEREMSNAFNNIVADGETAQTRIDEAAKTINREINRKMEEFGFIDGEGNILKEYEVPTIDKVREILGRSAGE